MIIELRGEKTCLWGFLPGLTQTGHEISDLGRKGIVLSLLPKQGTDQLRSYPTADLHLFTYAKSSFSYDTAQLKDLHKNNH